MKPVHVLTKSFGRFSAGTKFIIQDTTGGDGYISMCETYFPNSEGHRSRADIPTKYLTAVRAR